jgi:hypothetical protein
VALIPISSFFLILVHISSLADYKPRNFFSFSYYITEGGNILSLMCVPLITFVKIDGFSERMTSGWQFQWPRVLPYVGWDHGFEFISEDRCLYVLLPLCWADSPSKELYRMSNIFITVRSSEFE